LRILRVYRADALLDHRSQLAFFLGHLPYVTTRTTRSPAHRLVDLRCGTAQEKPG